MAQCDILYIGLTAMTCPACGERNVTRSAHSMAATKIQLTFGTTVSRAERTLSDWAVHSGQKSKLHSKFAFKSFLGNSNVWVKKKLDKLQYTVALTALNS